MPFSIDPSFNSIRSYEQALARWNENNGFTKSNPVTGEYAERALDGRKRHMTLRKLTPHEIAPYSSDPALTHIAFKLHRTDVVIYREDNAVIITRYPSMSTNAFADKLTPNHVGTHFDVGRSWGGRGSTNPYSHDLVRCDNLTSEGSDPSYWWSEGDHRVYAIKGNHILLTRNEKGEYFPRESDIDPWMVPTLDKRLARQVLKASNYHAFMCYAHATTHLTFREGVTYGRRKREDSPTLTDTEMLACLADDSQWCRLLADPVYWPLEPHNGPGFADLALERHQDAVRADARGYLSRMHCEHLGQALRLALYEDSPGTLQVVPTPSVANMRALSSLLKKQAYYGIAQ